MKTIPFSIGTGDISPRTEVNNLLLAYALTGMRRG